MPSVIVDASLAVRLVIDEPGSAEAQAKWTEWKQEQVSIAAPTLLVYEAVNGLHQAWRGGFLTADELTQSLVLLIGFPIRYHEPLSLANRATQLARDLQLGATYDSFYIALAEALRCEFWTGDKRLYNNIHKRVTFVRSLWED